MNINDLKEFSGPMSATPTRIEVSVVVPTCGRPELLERCLRCLVRQQFDPVRYEIIVVDDAPNDNTRRIVEAWARTATSNGLDVLYIPSPGPHGPAAARNRGWRVARGAVVAFTDDDTAAQPEWLREGMQALAPDVEAVWGRLVMPLSGTPTDYERDAKGLESAEFVTANCLCRKSALARIGGFDERFEFAWREDADLYFRLLDQGGKVAHAPAALVVHPIRPAPWGVSLRQQKKIQSDALLYKKHSRRYREKIRATPRWDYYAIVILLALAIAASFTGHLSAAAIAGALWAAFTLRFFVMRMRGTVKTVSHMAEMLVTSALIPPVAVYWRMVGALKFRAALL